MEEYYYEESPAAFDSAEEYLEAYPDQEYPVWEAYAEDAFIEQPAPAGLFDYLRTVSMSLPVWAVVFIGVCLVTLTSFINYDKAAVIVNAHNLSTAVTSLDASPNRDSGAAGTAALPAMFAPSVLYWQADILRWAAEQGVDPLLAATVMQIESCGYSRALSRAGAMGLFQVMPYHFQAGEDGFDPATNALRGLSFLRQALNAHQDDARLALAAYNAGITGSSRPETAWPAETQRYVYWGMGIYADAQTGNQNSARLQEWLAAGGSSLCSQASQALNLP